METINAPATIRHPAFTAAVKAAQLFSATGRGRSALEWYTAVSLQSCVDGLTVSAGCIDQTARITIGGEFPPISAMIGGDVAKLVARDGGGGVTISADDSGAERLTIGGATVPTAGPAEERHSVDAPTGETRTYLIPWASWVAAESAAAATDTESVRYALGCVLLDCADGRGVFVGTDGRRLHAVSTPVSVHGADGTALIRESVIYRIRKAAETLARAVTGQTGKKLAATLADTAVTVQTDGARQVFSWSIGDVHLTAGEMECQGRFPRWRDVVKDNPDAGTATFDGATLRAQVVAAAAVTHEADKGVRFAGGGGVDATISAGKPGGYSGEYCAPLAGDTPVRMNVSLDPRFMVDAIDAAAAVAPGALLAVEFVSGCPLSPVIYRVAGGLTPPAGEMGLTVVIMPLAAD
jgi:hypothetical protein